MPGGHVKVNMFTDQSLNIPNRDDRKVEDRFVHRTFSQERNLMSCDHGTIFFIVVFSFKHKKMMNYAFQSGFYYPEIQT